MKTHTQHTRTTRATKTAVLLVLLTLTCVALAAPAKRTTTHGGVRITFDVTLAREATGQTVPAAPLEQESDKPDGVYPEHVTFTLVGMRDAPTDSFQEPTVRICPVAEYLKAFSVSPRYVRDAERTLNELRRLIRRKPAALRGNVPMLPFPDATEVFHAHVKYLRFQGGAGVAFLTQSQQDENLINAQQVSYEFRGLTDDGRYYISATFPVGAPVMAPTRDAGTHDGYMLPRELDRRQRQKYAAYVERTRRKLERLPSEQFTPSLRLYEELLSSIEIRK